MKILHVLDHSLPQQSGYAFRTAAILREQQNLGWTTLQLTGPKQGPSPVPAERHDGIEYLRTPGSAGWLARLPAGAALDVIRRLRKRIRTIVVDERPDIIHAHSPCLNGVAALGLGVPFVYEIRSSWEDAAVSNGSTKEGSARYRLSRQLETFVLRRADAVTTICDGLRRDVIERGVASRRITVIPNAVDPDAFASSSAAGGPGKSRWGLQGRHVIGFIGSLFAWEGLSLLLEAVPRIRAIRPDIAVLLVGSGIHETVLRAAARQRDLDGHVVFAGSLPHDRVREAYEAVDLVAFPRIPMRLTNLVTPLKPLEAMAMGKPVVASDVGGHRELIDDGRTGLLFRAGDATALADTILRIIQDPVLAETLRVQGLRHVREHRTWRMSVRGYENMYRELLQRPAA